MNADEARAHRRASGRTTLIVDVLRAALTMVPIHIATCPIVRGLLFRHGLRFFCIVCTLFLSHFPATEALANSVRANPTPHALPCNVYVPAPVHTQYPRPLGEGESNPRDNQHIWKPAVPQYDASAKRRGYDACKGKQGQVKHGPDFR
jgi:hypothetical protein